MNGFRGADTAALRDLADRFADRSQRLLELGEQILAQGLGVDWHGSDADEFRARVATVTGDLRTRSSEVQARSTELHQHAEEQDTASGSGTDGGGAGPWQAIKDFFSDISPWPAPSTGRPSTPSTFKERLTKVVEDLAEDTAWEGLGKGVQHVLDELKRPKYWGNLTRKAIPLVPDLFDAGQHAANGETKEFTMALMRAAYDFHPIMGPAETITSVIFPLAPDGWTFPGTDRRVNEGSIWDHVETTMVEYDDPNDRFNVAMREGEALGLETADRLGIENRTARNVFKSVAGAGGLVGEGQLDEDGNVPVLSLTPEQRQRIRDWIS